MKRFITGSISVFVLLSTAACAGGGTPAANAAQQNASAPAAQGGSAEPVSISPAENLQGEIMLRG